MVGLCMKLDYLCYLDNMVWWSVLHKAAYLCCLCLLLFCWSCFFFLNWCEKKSYTHYLSVNCMHIFWFVSFMQIFKIHVLVGLLSYFFSYLQESGVSLARRAHSFCNTSWSRSRGTWEFYFWKVFIRFLYKN